jgi:hypothetical protein
MINGAALRTTVSGAAVRAVAVTTGTLIAIELSTVSKRSI